MCIANHNGDFEFHSKHEIETLKKPLSVCVCFMIINTNQTALNGENYNQ